MYDNPNVTAYAHGPEVLVLCSVKLMKVVGWVGRVELQIERCLLDRLLFVTRQSGETVSECVGDSKLHQQLSGQNLRCALNFALNSQMEVPVSLESHPELRRRLK